MFSLFKKDPIKKLAKLHSIKLEEAMHAQRKGDMRLFAQLSAEADDIDKQMVVLEKANS